MLTAFLFPLLTACGDDDDSPKKNTTVVVNENGTTSNGCIFSKINDRNFSHDYVMYSVKDGHLAVSGYNPVGFKDEAKIVSKITVGENAYEVLEIGASAFRGCIRLTAG